MTLKGPINVEKIQYLGEGVLRITFDGTIKDIDILALNLDKRYPRLKDPNYLQKAFFEEGCIKWPEGGPWIDVDELEFIPETTKFKDKTKIAGYTERLAAALKKVIEQKN